MKKLQDDFPNFKILTIKECLDELNWVYETNENRYDNVHCDCGGEVEFNGWFGTEYGYCKECGKGMQDLLGVMPAGNSTAGVIKSENYDLSDNRHWTPENVWGFK